MSPEDSARRAEGATLADLATRDRHDDSVPLGAVAIIAAIALAVITAIAWWIV